MRSDTSRLCELMLAVLGLRDPTDGLPLEFEASEVLLEAGRGAVTDPGRLISAFLCYVYVALLLAAMVRLAVAGVQVAILTICLVLQKREKAGV